MPGKSKALINSKAASDQKALPEKSNLYKKAKDYIQRGQLQNLEKLLNECNANLTNYDLIDIFTYAALIVTFAKGKRSKYNTTMLLLLNISLAKISQNKSGYYVIGLAFLLGAETAVTRFNEDDISIINLTRAALYAGEHGFQILSSIYHKSFGKELSSSTYKTERTDAYKKLVDNLTKKLKAKAYSEQELITCYDELCESINEQTFDKELMALIQLQFTTSSRLQILFKHLISKWNDVSLAISAPTFKDAIKLYKESSLSPAERQIISEKFFDYIREFNCLEAAKIFLENIDMPISEKNHYLQWLTIRSLLITTVMKWKQEKNLKSNFKIAIKTVHQLVEKNIITIEEREILFQECLHIATIDNCKEAVEVLLEEKTDINASKLSWAIECSSFKNVDKAHQIAELPIKPLADMSFTPLIIAAIFNCGSVIDVLLNHGADIFYPAIRLQEAEQLAKQGKLGSYAPNFVGQTYARVFALHMSHIPVSKKIDIVAGSNAIIAAACSGQLTALKKLLTIAPHGIDSRTYEGLTPILVAFEYNHYDMVEYLINKGANLFHTDKIDGCTLLQKTEKNGKPKIIQLVRAAHLKKWFDDCRLDEKSAAQVSAQKDKLIQQLKKIRLEFLNDAVHIYPSDNESAIIFTAKQLPLVMAMIEDHNSLVSILDAIKKVQIAEQKFTTQKATSLILSLKQNLQSKFSVIAEAKKDIENIRAILNKLSNAEEISELTERYERIELLINKLTTSLNEFTVLTTTSIKQTEIELYCLLQSLNKKVGEIASALQPAIDSIKKKTQRLEDNLNRDAKVVATTVVSSSPQSLSTINAKTKPITVNPIEFKRQSFSQLAQSTKTKFKSIAAKKAERSIELTDDLQELLELDIDDSKPENRALCRNAMLWYCAELLANTNRWQERNVLFHHYDLLPIVSQTNSKQEEQQYAEIIDLAWGLIDDSASTLLTKISDKKSVRVTPFLNDCIDQLNYGLNDLALYEKLDCSLLPYSAVKAAEGFIAARLSTYVAPLLSRYSNPPTSVAEAEKIRTLIKKARPFRDVGNKARHGEDYDFKIAVANVKAPSAAAVVASSSIFADGHDHKDYKQSSNGNTATAAAFLIT